jgi:tetratricopeptide (TPR) repeat protein
MSDDININDNNETSFDLKPEKKKSKKWIIFLLLGLLAVSIPVAVFSVWYVTTPQNAEQWFSFGERHMTNLDYEKAELAFLKVIEIEPRNVPARLHLSDLYMIWEQFDKALVRLLEVLDIEPHNTPATRLIQDVYFELNYIPALEAFIDNLREAERQHEIQYGYVVGRIIDGGLEAGPNTPLTDATISITRRDLRRTMRVTTDENGEFRAIFKRNTAAVTIEAEGYLPLRRDVELFANDTVYMPTLELIPSDSEGEGTVSGRVINAMTGRGVPGAEIIIYAQNGNKLYETTTDHNGSYTFTQPAGYYTAAVSAEEYMDTRIEIAVTGTSVLNNRNLVITPVLDDSEWRIVLTWGATPRDLDSHLYIPVGDGTRRFVYYQNKNVYDNDRNLLATLDYDHTNSYGPETITIFDISNERYSYLVHDYSNQRANSTALANSNANVKVYRGSVMLREFFVPNYIVGDMWHVFDIVDGQVVSVNS